MQAAWPAVITWPTYREGEQTQRTCFDYPQPSFGLSGRKKKSPSLAMGSFKKRWLRLLCATLCGGWYRFGVGFNVDFDFYIVTNEQTACFKNFIEVDTEILPVQ